MMSRSSKPQPKLNTCVQIFSGLTQMKFKPINQNGSKTLNKRRQKLIKAKTEYIEIYDPLSMVLQADRKIQLQQLRRLKFIASLSGDHFIIGNENQIDMISFGAVAHGFVDTDYYWSLSLKAPIQSITVDTKKSIFVLLSDSIAYFYRYSIKNKELPVVVTQITLNQRVRFIRFLKDILLGFFYETRFEIYNIQKINLIKKKLDKSYPTSKEKKLLTIPPSIDNIINLFFQQPKQSKQSFILWCLEINFQGQQIRTRQLYRVYDVMNYAKGKLSIQNYTKDIIFMNLKNQLMAIKNGYLLDTVNVSVNQQGQILKYIHPQTILHITKRNVQVYNFSINLAVKPGKIVLTSIDSIQIQNIPQDAFYITVLQTLNNNFAIFFQDSEKKKYQSRGEITYYFEISQTTTLKQKINSLFESISLGMSADVLEEKYNMAKKMGLSQREIYLEIWNRSNKSSIEDYQYILATKDYKTIKLELQKKLKKQSMNLRQILRIQQACLEVNRHKIENTNPTEQDFQDYVTSKFLMRKFRLYRQINIIDRNLSILNSQDSIGQGKMLKIDIQQYCFFKNTEIKSFLVDQMADMLFSFKNNAKIIRVIIKHFKFTYRMIYKQLLEQIIKASKDEIINLLNEIPELLPYIYHDLNEDEHNSGLFDGIWGGIQTQQWEDALFPDAIQNIHNRQVLAQFVNSIWFKRYWLTTHDMVNKNKNEIILINQIHNSDKIFYFFIARIYEYTKDNKSLYYQIVNFLQEKYELFPSHLRNKSFLYENLYIYYYHQEINNPNRLSFTDFLEQDDQHLFKYFFDHEKVKKNSLLKQIKPIYEQSDANGSHIFNIGLFAYFYSDLSKISDLKFILNRINNQKTQFHQKNFGIYKVLVRSMQLKMKLGGEQNIPMDQVMIYIQNIPLDKNNQIMQQLFVMQKIKEEADRFNDMKINMSVKQIIDSCDFVIGRIVYHEICKRKVTSITDWNQFKEQSLSLLEDVQKVRRKIYNNGQSNFTLLVYLCLVLENQNMIEKVAQFLQDESLHNLYIIQEQTVQNIVIYMYKWKLSRQTTYLANEQYLKNLLELLPQENQSRIYLQSQLQLAVMLSCRQVPIYYPISKTSNYPTTNDIQQIFKFMKTQQLLKVDPQKVYSYLNKLENIILQNNTKPQQFTSEQKINQIYIAEMLQRKLFLQTLPQLYKILELKCPVKNGNIIYVILFVLRIAQDFNQESKKCIFKLVALLFFEPVRILNIIECSMKTKLTGLEQTKNLRDTLVKQSAERYNYNPKNPILSHFFCQNYKKDTTKQAIEYYRSTLKTSTQDVQRSNEYDLIFTIICQSPYLLAKYLDMQKDRTQLKTLKNYLLAIAYRDVFHSLRTLQLLKRVFTILIISNKQNKDVSFYIQMFENRSIQQEYQLTKIKLPEGQHLKIFNLYVKHYKNIKKKFQSEQGEKIRAKRLQKLKSILQNPNIILFDHIQVEQLDEQNIKLNKSRAQNVKKQKKNAIWFDVVNERKNILKRIIPFRQYIRIKQIIDQNKEASENEGPKLIEKKKDNNYHKLRNSMIEQLYSHKVVNKSDYNDQFQDRKQDQDFLGSFVPKKAGIRDSNVSLESKDSKQSPQDQNNTPITIRLGEKDKEKQVLQLVKVIDTQLNDEHNIQIGNYNYIQPQVLDQIKIYTRLVDRIVSSFNENRVPKFDLSSLDEEIYKIVEQMNEDESIKEKKQDFLIGFIKFIYQRPVAQKGIHLNLIEQIARRHPESCVNNFFLQAYQRIYATHQKYGLKLDISSILPLSGIYIKSKNIFDLYLQVEPLIIPKINEENIFKLSKLIALGFRKNVVQQEILLKFAKKMMINYLKINQQEREQLFEKIRMIWQKLQTSLLVEKAQSLFQGIEHGQRRDFLLNSLLESLKNKGYVTASRELAVKLSQ